MNQARIIQLVNSEKSFRTVKVHHAKTNLGVYRSLTRGISKVLEGFDRIIMIEDHVVVGRLFLRFMNESLDTYEAVESVASIHGYVYPSNISLPETFFMRGADCWGWGTWKRAWSMLNSDESESIERIHQRGLGASFTYDGKAPFMNLLKKKCDGTNDSWAILWHTSTYLNNMYTLYPGHPLAMNVGNDGSGQHSGMSRKFDVNLCPKPVTVRPMTPLESQIGRLVFAKCFENLGKRSFWSRIKGRVRRSRRPS